MNSLAFFWDIENCQVPSSKSALDVVKRLREKFGENLAEVEFIVVCDVFKERRDLIDELSLAQVTLIHVNALAKNACDDKLRTSMTKFSFNYKPPGVVVLISSDVDFTQSLTDLRYRCGFRTILLHNEQVSTTLLEAANEDYSWQNDILAWVPDQPTSNRRQGLSDNSGGRVFEYDSGALTEVIGFTSCESAGRAQIRIDGADVFGTRILANALNSGGAAPGSGAGASGMHRRSSPNPQSTSTSTFVFTPPVPIASERSVDDDDISETVGNRAAPSPAKLRLLERFTEEAVELLRASPKGFIYFEEFAWRWSKNYRRPLCLGDFGHTKLAELLEEVSDTFRISGHGKEKCVTLTSACRGQYNYGWRQDSGVHRPQHHRDNYYHPYRQSSR